MSRKYRDIFAGFRWSWLWALLTVLFSCPVLASEPARYVVLIVVDGCRPDYLQLAPLPNLRALVESGTSYDSAWVGQVPTNTPVSHATLGTGVFASRHNVVGFYWKDAATGKNIFPATIGNVRRGLFTRVIADAGVPTVCGLYKEAFPGRLTLAMSSVKPYAALTMGTDAADLIVFASSPKKPDAWGEEPVEREKVCKFECLPGHEVDPETLQQINGKLRRFEEPGDFDTWVVDAFLEMFARYRPHLSMLNLPAIDEMGHLCGGTTSPSIMRPIIENVDIQIGRIVRAFREAGVFDETLFIVTADHAMASNTVNASVWSYSRAFIRSGELPQLGVTTPFIWLRNGDQSARVAWSMTERNPLGVDQVFYKTSEGKQTRYRKAGPDHGDPLLDAAWEYLFETVTCPNSSDLYLRLRENTVIGRKYRGLARGKHYQGTWLTQHIPLVLSGPGVKAGYSSNLPARLVDIAPTLLILSGVEPKDMDGVVLADALTNGEPGERARQASVSEKLAVFQQALIATSRSDVQTNESLAGESPTASPWIFNIMFSTVLVLAGAVIGRSRTLSRRGKGIGLFSCLIVFVGFQLAFIWALYRILEL